VTRRAGATVAAVLVSTAMGVLGVLPPVQAAVPDPDSRQPAPAPRAVVFVGHGYGHGHGMSQHGAYGAAEQGLTTAQILGFYYPGTVPAAVRGRVRVLITSNSTTDLVVSPTSGLSVRDRGDRTTYPLPEIAGATRWRLTVAEGRTVAEYLTDQWTRWLPDGKAGFVGDGQFQATGPLTLWTPAGAKTYRGKLRAASPTPGSDKRSTVNVLSMDDYLKGVIPHEMPPTWHAEAVKSQAVAARTYAAWSRAQNKKRYYQICDTTSCQVYGGMDAEHPLANAAVASTARQILTHDGKPAFTQFSSSSGGWTAAGSVPYLPAQEDPYDGHAANPVHTWAVTVDVGRLERAYPAIGELRRIRVTNRDGNGEWLGRARTIQLDGTQADRTITGDSFRWAFGLRSTWFTIDQPS